MRTRVDDAAQRGIHLRMVNLGGGLPARYTEQVPADEHIGELASRAALRTFGSNVEYAFEPGRALVADPEDADRPASSARRSATVRPWVFVEFLSIYAGLLEVIGGWSYAMRRPGSPTQKQVTLGGPDPTAPTSLQRHCPAGPRPA